MTERDWDLRGSRLHGFQFAEWLLDDDGPGIFRNRFQPEGDAAWAAAQARGWIETVRPTSNDGCRPGFRGLDPWPKLTDAGRLEIDRIRGLRENPQARAAGCREALLDWLAHQGKGAGSAPVMVIRDEWTFYATPFTVDEANQAARFLTDEGLIATFRYPDGTYMKPVLTTKGTQCIEYFDGNIREFLFPTTPGTPVNNQYFNGPFYGQNAQGDNNAQAQNSGVDAAELAQVFTAMRQALGSIEDTNDRDDVEHHIRELESAVIGGTAEDVQASAGRLRRLGDRIGNAALTSATTVGVKELLYLLNIG